MNNNIVVKVLSVLVVTLVVMLGITSQPAVAGVEDPPKPGFFTVLLGGEEHYREGVIKWLARLDVPEEYRPLFKKPMYVKGMEIPQGTTIRLYILSHFGQKKIDGAAETEVHVSRPGMKEGFESLWKSRMGMVKAEKTLDEWADEPVAFRMYLTPDGRHLNAYEFCLMYVVSREEVFRRMGITPPAKPEDARVPADFPRGRVTVQSDNGSPIASATVVVKTAEGKEIEFATRQDIPGVYTFDQVPVGEVRLKVSNRTDEPKWRLLGPPQLLRQNLGKGGTVNFILTQQY